MENGIGVICKNCNSIAWKYKEVCQCKRVAFIDTPRIENGMIFSDSLLEIEVVKVYYQNKMLLRFTRMPIALAGKPVFMEEEAFKSIFKEVDNVFFRSQDME